jgi:hypothetical protein
MMRRDHILLYGFLLMAFAAQVLVWMELRPQQAEWANVPPAPSADGAAMSFLGDKQMAYRAIGIMLQNMGDEGGRVAALKDYNYIRLGRWFKVQHELDPRSDYTPLLAAYYFGANEDVKDLDSVIEYLTLVGDSSYSNKWRWLSQAMYLARIKQNDLDKALRLSYRLADMYKPGMPAWVVQMPSFILAQKGDQEAAYDLAIKMIRDEGHNMHPNEINFMKDYICTRILNEAQAAMNPLCAEPIP